MHAAVPGRASGQLQLTCPDQGISASATVAFSIQSIQASSSMSAQATPPGPVVPGSGGPGVAGAGGNVEVDQDLQSWLG